MRNDVLTHARLDGRFDPFDSALLASRPLHTRAALAAARPFLSWLCALKDYQRLYERSRAFESVAFATRALRVLDISVDLADGSELGIPAHGPLIVAANHPHGIVDGLALVELLRRSREDVRVLTNDLLAWLPDVKDMCLFVNAFDERAAPQTRAGLRAAMRWLRQGHALVVFPAGAVAYEDWRASATPVDGPWRDTAARLALNSGASVVPVHIAGRNRDVFYRAGELHPWLRTMLLPRELLAKRGGRITARLGKPMTLARHDAHESRGAGVTALLRAHADRLAERAPMVSNTSRDVRADISQLGPDHRLLQSGRFDVYCAPASRLGGVMLEIGRLRELTFRSVGEGTGNAIDLDRFDDHYLQLFVWDREAATIAGAYRLGPVDSIVATHGAGGLYTSTLYWYDERLLSRLGPAIELGRSFVRAEYQRSSNALLLLWKGIAQFIIQSPQYRVLFGPVSISARYSDMSRQLLQAFLLQNARHEELSGLVQPVTPPSAVVTTVANLQAIRDLQSLDRLIAGYEVDGKGIPVLLRHYLRLNAKLLAFNLDPNFGDALDALMMVDLADVDRAILTRYFGRQHAALLRRPTHPAAA